MNGTATTNQEFQSWIDSNCPIRITVTLSLSPQCSAHSVYRIDDEWCESNGPKLMERRECKRETINHIDHVINYTFTVHTHWLDILLSNNLVVRQHTPKTRISMQTTTAAKNSMIFHLKFFRIQILLVKRLYWWVHDHLEITLDWHLLSRSALFLLIAYNLSFDSSV